MSAEDGKEASGWLEPVVALLGLPADTASVFLFGFFRRDYGAAGLFDLNGQGLLTLRQLTVAAITLTLFVPCIAQFLNDAEGARRAHGYRDGRVHHAVRLRRRCARQHGSRADRMVDDVLCGFCGRGFAPDDAQPTCAACPLKGGCQLARCPYCGYENAVAPVWFTRIRDWLHPSREEERCH